MQTPGSLATLHFHQAIMLILNLPMTNPDRSRKFILLVSAGEWRCSTGGEVVRRLPLRGLGGLETRKGQRHLRLRLCRPSNRSSAATPHLIILHQVRPVLHLASPKCAVCNEGNQLTKGNAPSSNQCCIQVLRIQYTGYGGKLTLTDPPRPDMLVSRISAMPAGFT